jgi:hypothetical protein
MRWKYAAAASAVVALIALGAAQARVSRAQSADPGPASLAPAREPASEPTANPSPEPLLPPPEPDAPIPPPAPGDVPARSSDLLPVPGPPPPLGTPPIDFQEPPSTLETLPSDAAAPLLSPRPEPVATPLLDRVGRPIDSRIESAAPPPVARERRPMDDDRPPFGDPEASPPTSDGEREIRALVRRLAESDPGAESWTIPPEGAREDWSRQLRARLAGQFTERQRRYAAEVDALEARVAKLRELIRKREENSERIIDDRVKQLMTEAQGMGW